MPFAWSVDALLKPIGLVQAHTSDDIYAILPSAGERLEGLGRGEDRRRAFKLALLDGIATFPDQCPGRFARGASTGERPSRGVRGCIVEIGGGGGNRTRVRRPSTVRTTCLAWFFNAFALRPPTGRLTLG